MLNNPPPKVINGYTFGVVLGQGGFGKVCKCTKDGKEFAVKEIYGSMMDLDMEESFATSVSAKLNSPFLVKYLDAFRGPSNELYVVMELCPKGDLRALIGKLKELHATLVHDRLMHIVVQLLLGLYKLHCNKYLHRDLKPENIFVDKDDNAKIGDFGCSKKLNRTGDLAHTGIGTPLYESPQIIAGESYDASADMWALGVLLYEMCTLEWPFYHSNPYRLMELIQAGRFKEIPAERAPAEVIQSVYSLLSVDPTKRPSALGLLSLPVIHNFAVRFDLLKFFPSEAFPVTVGVLAYPTAEDRYEGSVRRGVPHGKGLCVYGGFRRGRVYQGDWVDGIKKGRGKETFEALTYEGEFDNNRNHGKGTCTVENEFQYVGDFRDGRIEGHGRCTYRGGRVYEGQWKKDAAEGRGTQTYPNGEKYVGDFSGDARHGQGTQTDREGRVIYTGLWRNDKPVAQ